MKPTQPIMWTNHEIEDLKDTIQNSNTHLLAIARNIETLSKVIDNISVNVMFMALVLTLGPWFFSHVKMA